MKRPWDHQPWVEPYRLALLETNLDELSQRIQVAKTAIGARIGELEDSKNYTRELHELNNALKVLRVMLERGSVRCRVEGA
jgi:hypothetical protein